MSMSKIGKFLAAAGAATLAIAVAGSAPAAPIILTSVVDQSGFNGPQGGGDYPLATYDFTGQLFAQLTSINEITITLTVLDGDSAPAEFDFNNLTLGLRTGGSAGAFIDTGLVLNGFAGGQVVTATLSAIPPSQAAALLSALQVNGTLDAAVIDADADPGLSGNNIAFPFVVQTSLDIVGDAGGGPGPNPIPLPAAVLLAPLGAAIGGFASRRFRRA